VKAINFDGTELEGLNLFTGDVVVARSLIGGFPFWGFKNDQGGITDLSGVNRRAQKGIIVVFDRLDPSKRNVKGLVQYLEKASCEMAFAIAELQVELAGLKHQVKGLHSLVNLHLSATGIHEVHPVDPSAGGRRK
jgi:hypothetical protein